MTELARGPDYLRLHANVRNRVRNLETGVHPTGSGLNYYDTFGPAEIDIRSASNWQLYVSGLQSWPPYWQRRTGLVMLTGAVMLESGGSLVADEWLATLPAEARPMVGPIQQQVSAETAPFRARISIHANGELHLLTDGLSGSPIVWLDGATWAVN